MNTIFLQNNSFTDPIPQELGHLVQLQTLILGNNSFSGTLPPNIGLTLPNLDFFDIRDNRLSGPILASMPNLRVLSVRENGLGNDEDDDMSFLYTLSNSSNCESLEYLYLDGNLFQGPISESLRSLRALQDLNLSHNNLTGQIPKFLGDSKLLQSLDLSFNDLEGEVPMHGVFENTSAVSISGNKNLCGGVLQLNLPKCRSKSTKPESSTKLALIVAIPSYKDLLQATNGFSSDNLIGAGSFGSVYKGVFTFDGVIVAVKVFNLLREGASKSFMRECSSLLRIRHRYLVKVLCAYAGVDFQGNDFKALVYEFMMNGSLEEWLHPIHALDQEVHKPKNLNLIQSLNIAIDVANALDYLHKLCWIEKHRRLCCSSYGILLLEMITGKRPTDSMFKDGLELHSFVKMALPDRVVDVADPKLMIEVDQADQIVECLISICEIGVFCSENVARERMDISSAVAELNQTKVNFLGRHG
uniref:Protein kinase domain-containing protein n=1 Tax=Salix viminalis TaxID=40686 RepID=A0A6N2NJF2_SALVM